MSSVQSHAVQIHIMMTRNSLYIHAMSLLRQLSTIKHFLWCNIPGVSPASAGFYVGSGFLFFAQILLWMNLLPPFILAGFLYRRREIWISHPSFLVHRTEAARVEKWKKKLLKIQRKSAMLGAGRGASRTGTGGGGGIMALAKAMSGKGESEDSSPMGKSVSFGGGQSMTGGGGSSGGVAAGGVAITAVRELLNRGTFSYDDCGIFMLGKKQIEISGLKILLRSVKDIKNCSRGL